jgi:hypothetical protein
MFKDFYKISITYLSITEIWDLIDKHFWENTYVLENLLFLFASF